MVINHSKKTLLFSILNVIYAMDLDNREIICQIKMENEVQILEFNSYNEDTFVVVQKGVCSICQYYLEKKEKTGKLITECEVEGSIVDVQVNRETKEVAVLRHEVDGDSPVLTVIDVFDNDRSRMKLRDQIENTFISPVQNIVMDLNQ